VRLEALKSKVLDLEALVGRLVARYDWRIADEWIVDTWVWYQVGLELVQVDVESTVESQAGSDGADNLSNESIQVLVVRTRDVEVTATDIVDSFVVDQESTI